MKMEKVELSKTKNESKLYQILPVLICGLSIPLSIFMWLGNLAYSRFIESEDEYSVVHPTRWLAAVLIPILIAAYGLKKKSVNPSGAALGLLVGFIQTLSSYGFLACLMTFFVTSSRATKFRPHRKIKIEEDFKDGGQRNWIQVLCNSGMATQLALLYILDCGCGERPINFVANYRASWLSLGVLGAFSCCNGDTWASELGSVIGSGDPFLIMTGRRVPRGTNGGVSIAGFIFSWLGGTVVGAAMYLVLIYTVDTALLDASPPQWPLIFMGGLGGFLGSLLDSLLGATLQYSGQNKNGAIVERPGPGIKHITGKRILDNHSVNLLSSITMGLILPKIAIYFFV